MLNKVNVNLESTMILIAGIILAISSFFVVNIDISGYSTISVVFITALALPSLLAIIKNLEGRGLALILLLGVYAILIETAAIITGFPYSEFHYTDAIGLKIFGYTPFTVPFAWLPLFIGSAYLATKFTERRFLFLIIATVFVVLSDIVIDPAAVALKFWVWESYGPFYGVPLQNFMGWVLSGFIAALIYLLLLGDRYKDIPDGAVSSLYLIMCFWTAACLFLGLELPFLSGLILIAVILRKSHFKIW